MEWWEKVELMLANRRQSVRAFEREAGFREGFVSQPLHKKSDIRVSRALAISRALGVSTDWLFDPTSEFADLAPAENPELRRALAVVDLVIRDVVARVQRGETQKSELGRALRERLGLPPDPREADPGAGPESE